MGSLTAHWQSATVANPLEGTDLHLALDVLRDLASQVSLDAIVGLDELANLLDLVVREIPYLGIGIDIERHTRVERPTATHTEDVGQSDLDPLVAGKVNS